METDDVVIVGGGPVGLMLACELKLAGVEAVVLEQLAAPTGLSKALGIQGKGVDLLELRGLVKRFGDVPTARMLHFAGIPLDTSKLEGAQPKFLFVVQAHVERVLEERAKELGVDVRRGHALESFEQSDDHVLVQARSASGPVELRTRYLVGCDGSHSVVRTAAGIGFPGLDATMLLRLGDVKLAGNVTFSAKGAAIDGKPVPFGVGIPVGEGYIRVVTREPIPEGFDRSTPMSLDELRASMAKHFPGVPAITEARWLSRFTDASRQAETYRKGRVLLAGDAAHIHLPAGGPGLSTGLNDAANLGWKLAATLKGTAPEGLLDTYQTERHPAGARVLMHTRAQGALLINTPQIAELRKVLAEAFATPGALRFMVDLMQGADVRYDMGQPNAPDSVGHWASSATVSTSKGERGLGELMKLPKGLLLRSPDLAVMTPPNVEEVAVREGPSRLIRPDGYVAWEGPGPGLGEAATRWFGAS